ncbi:MAG: hypothetical protein DYG89_19855 [Caldilinea sp. CFX5]|nr:hypothetical protein [Caldilinea sp. CFX5]
MTNAAPPWIVKPLVAEEVYTDRAEFLEYFYGDALRAATRRSMSTVLLGRRRMGKTEIFERVVNRLFFEQDPTSPQAVVPVYYSFGDKKQDRWDFAKEYLENFIRHYLAFYARQPEIIIQSWPTESLLPLLQSAKATHPYPDSLDTILRWYDAMLRQRITLPEKEAIEIPRRISDIYDSTIVVFLDEFQNTRLPHYDFDVVGLMKEAVESPTCPHFVTGSAMSILAREIIGRGSLFGRFESHPIGPLSHYWGAEQALRSARYFGATLPELMAPVVAERCGGNPFYINAVIRQAAKLPQPLADEEAINTVLAVDLSSGFIWAELYEQVSGWIERISEYGITKWILYLSALEEEERINIGRIQQALAEREGKNVPLDKIRDVLVRLSRGDLLEYLELGRWFRKTDDPILLEFLKVWGRIEVEGQEATEVRREIVTRYQNLTKQIDEYKGYLAEVFMSQVLLNSQQQRQQPYPGHFFNSPTDIAIPWPLNYVRHRVRLASGQKQEIDLLGAFGGEMWVCQSKWETTRKMGVAVLQELLAQAATVQAEYKPNAVRMWLFAHEGLTKEAEKLAREQGILWSTRTQLDELLTYLGLRKLPALRTSELVA